MNENKKKAASLNDTILYKSKEQAREDYKQKYGYSPKPLTEQQKKEYGLN